MTFASALTHLAAELALFSAAGFLLFAINDLAVDAIYFTRRFWRSATVYRRYPRTFGSALAEREDCV
jgi:adsorption protein B